MVFFLDLRACIYKKNKLNLIKEQRHALHLDTLFPTKKQILYIKSFRTNNVRIRHHKKHKSRKSEKHFPKSIFSQFYAFFVRFKENNHKLSYFFKMCINKLLLRFVELIFHDMSLVKLADNIILKSIVNCLSLFLLKILFIARMS